MGAAISIGTSNIMNFITASILLKYFVKQTRPNFWHYSKEETHHLSAEFWLGVTNIPLTSLSEFSRCFLILYISSSGPSNFMSALVLLESLDKLQGFLKTGYNYSCFTSIAICVGEQDTKKTLHLVKTFTTLGLVIATILGASLCSFEKQIASYLTNDEDM